MKPQGLPVNGTLFTQVVRNSPVGLFVTNATGKLTWYEVSASSSYNNIPDNWLESMRQEGCDPVVQMWQNVFEDKMSSSCECRINASWDGKNGEKGYRWVLIALCPDIDENGSLRSVSGSITDISYQKYVEECLRIRIEEAAELKSRQENFMDMNSHEMRNPLSAILQCADEISSSLNAFKAGEDQEASCMTAESCDSNINAAQTIILCANHQKRIIDDVLTLSKLNSSLLLVTPDDVQPVEVVTRAMKMFERELLTHKITLDFQVADEYWELGINWTRLDPSRVLQVLVNLMTNAIKFTSAKRVRRIEVILSASLKIPSEQNSFRVSYFPSRSTNPDRPTSQDCVARNEVYIHVAVRDTGCGLNDSEMQLLFRRFSQAQPRTHVQYGGSGLGLFISRELTELQGGEIGVASESGKGSTFAFYVKATRSELPNEEIQREQSREFPDLSQSRYSSETGTVASEELSPANVQYSLRPAELCFRLLLVEDNLVNQRVLERQLQKLGCIVYVASHGQAALDCLKESTFWNGQGKAGIDVTAVLMDLEMPVMDGLTCTRKIREWEITGTLTRHVPIIAMTANARPDQIKSARDIGVDDVLLKPFRVPDLIAKVKGLVTMLAANQLGGTEKLSA
ncbi:hypothetical protein VE00_03337 [Pseudogymnoascus sp. WSF 3629]|nr:hypothetical protein VE00_03337 [Pseudogymnoascus sp. WSF 3629]